MVVIGVHGRNDEYWSDVDFEAVKFMRLGWLKMMSNTSPDVFKRLKDENPELKFITRLYDGGFGEGHRHPTPDEFAEHMIPVIETLIPYCDMFQIHNEPNHMYGVEGWGDTEKDAKYFTAWFIFTYNALKSRFPDCQFGFPGLAIPHRDLMWLEICKPAIDHADWLGVHCYWQNPTEKHSNHLNGEWGLKFVQYSKYKKDLYILEAGNSNGQANPPYPLPENRMSEELIQWFWHVKQYKYVKAACPFLLSSPDPTWNNQGFTWITSDGRFKQIIFNVEELTRQQLEDNNDD